MSIIETVFNKFGYHKKAKSKEKILFPDVSFMGGLIATGMLTYKQFCDAYRSWVYTCIDKNAKTIAMLPYGLYYYETNGKMINNQYVKSKLNTFENKYERERYLKDNNINKVQVDSHPFLELLKHPNSIDTRFKLWYNIILRLELAGYCGIYMPKNMLGLPGELKALPLQSSASLEPIPDGKEIIKGYKYKDGTVNETIEKDEMLYLNYPDPSSPLKGKSPIQSQAYPYDIDMYLEQQQYALLKNKATFGNHFTTDQRLKGSQVTDLKELIADQYAGAINSGKPMFTHSGLKLDSGKLSSNIKDLMLEQVSEFSFQKIISAYDLTPGKLGLLKDVNRSIMEVLDATYYKECIKPKVMLIEEEFETFVLPRYDQGDKLSLDFDLPDDINKELEIKETEMNLKYGKTTINEERSKEGKDDVPWGDKPWFPFNMVQVGSNPKVETEPEPDTEEDTEGDTEKSIELKGLNFELKLLDSTFWTKEKKEKAVEIFIKNTETWEKLLTPILKANFKRQKKEVLERLEKHGNKINGHINGWGKQKIRKWLSEHKDKLSDININKKEEVVILIGESEEVFKEILMQSGNARLLQLGLEETFDFNTDVEKWLSSRLREYSKQVTGTTFDDIQAILREGFREGLPLTTIADNLKVKFGKYDKYRANMISRTETISASNYSDLEAIKQNNLDKKLDKFWLAELDARDTHGQAGIDYSEDNAIKANALFKVGSDSMQYPGGGSEAGENVNCRCTLGYVEKK